MALRASVRRPSTISIPALIATDAFRVMMGRIAMSWDGGQILE